MNPRNGGQVFGEDLDRAGTGRALRAVADDHQAAQSIGIPLNRIWVIVWFVAGITALVAGMIWGSKLGVQFALTTVALRALPVIILGGLTSVPGAIIGGLIIGVGEKLSEVYLGPMVGGDRTRLAYVSQYLSGRPKRTISAMDVATAAEVSQRPGSVSVAASFALFSSSAVTGLAPRIAVNSARTSTIDSFVLSDWTGAET